MPNSLWSLDRAMAKDWIPFVYFDSMRTVSSLSDSATTWVFHPNATSHDPVVIAGTIIEAVGICDTTFFITP
ncbi:MAG: hypothetical protein ABIK89_25715 [Planctomycetota bacterium]